MASSHQGTDGVLLYHQVELAIRKKIESGEWPLGSRLPIETKLAEDFGVSRTTVRQAVDALVEAGLVKRRQGSGSYIAKSALSRSRFAAQPSPTVCRYIYAPILKKELHYSYHNLLRIMTAHVLMLKKQGIIPAEDAKTLLNFIVPLHESRSNVIGSNPLNEDAFLNFEQYMITNLGLSVGSRVLVARSRNDMTPTMYRMSARDGLLAICRRLSALLDRLMQLAAENQGRLITGYTHLQPSEPMTLEFYFLGVAEALERDYERLLDAYGRLNRSPLGGCAITGTSYPIDRDYTARLLGFDGLILNTLDAVASRDFLLEITAAFSQAGSTIARFTEDLYLWSTAEFGFVQFSDAVSCCSSIMPQKKNPLSAEHVKSRSAHLTAAYADIAMSLKGTVFTHCRDLFECMTPFWTALEQMTGILELSIDMLTDLKFHYERMEENASRGFVTATDISDYLEREEKFPFRMAHSILALATDECAKKGTDTLSLEDLNRISQKVCEHETALSEETLSRLQSPRDSVNAKQSAGSPSPEACAAQTQVIREALSRDNSRYHKLMAALKESALLRQQEVKACLSD